MEHKKMRNIGILLILCGSILLLIGLSSCKPTTDDQKELVIDNSILPLTKTGLEVNRHELSDSEINEFIYDGCTYIIIDSNWDEGYMAHKGNCSNH